MRVLLYSSIFLLFFVTSCQDRPRVEKSASLTTDPPKAKVSFRCEALGEDENEVPKVQVFLVVNDESIKIADVNACDPIESAEYQRFNIPNNAVAACGGWWAGAGDYFYAVEIRDQILVMKGWQEENQEDDGFHYEQLTSVPIK